MEWRILGGDRIDLISYVKNYIENKPETQVFIGTDSQNRTRQTKYAYVVVLYTPSKGGRVLYSRESLPKIKDLFSRLWREVEKSIEIAESLRESGVEKTLTIDLDLNQDKKYRSNTVLTSAVGYVTSMGYSCRVKPDAASASYCADILVKNF